MVKIMENPIKMDDLGETSIWNASWVTRVLTALNKKMQLQLKKAGIRGRV